MQSRSKNKQLIKMSLRTVNWNGSKRKLYSLFPDLILAWKFFFLKKKKKPMAVKGTLPYQNPKCIYPE